MSLAHLSDEELLSSLSSICVAQRRLLTEVLIHLIEVEDRRLELRSAYSSLYDFCLRRLGMSESEAVRRIAAARLVKRYPCLLDYLERGALNLTGLLLLDDHFTADNVHEIARAATGKSKREVQELIAAKMPRPDVLPTITQLPAQSGQALPSPAQVTARIEPTAPMRHRLELTIGDEVRAKLERARDLMAHRVPSGNLEAVLDKALDALLIQLEKERPGDGIPMAVRREVFARDGERCTFADGQGNRCCSRTRLELDHVIPRARGGRDDATNLRVLCRRHNQLHAEQAFGREHIEAHIDIRQRRNEDAQAIHVTERALVKMGFRAEDVRRRLKETFPPPSPLPPLPELLKTALTAMVS